MVKIASKITTTFVVLLLALSSMREAEAKNLKSEQPILKKHEALTQPMSLYPGEVTNTFHTIEIPPGPIAIYEFSADIVELDPVSGEIIQTPLSDAYLHHHVVFSNHSFYKENKYKKRPMKRKDSSGRGVGFGAGTESRGTVQRFPFPYAFTTVKGEDNLIANVHMINTRSMEVEKAHHCLECPCTKEDKDAKFYRDSKYGVFEARDKKFLEKNGLSSNDLHDESTNSSSSSNLLSVVKDRRLDWNQCNDELTDADNTACSPDLYHGGLICCEDGEFCLDEYYLTDDELVTLNALQPHNHNPRLQQSTYYLRYSLKYSEVVSENKPVTLASCCDVSGNLTEEGNVEYDIPQLCDPNDPNVDLSSEDCVHEVTTVQYLSSENEHLGVETTIAGDDFVDVVYMVGHLHRGGMEVSAYIHETNELLCKSLPTYGDGEVKEIGNEPGYINSMSDCSFDPPLRMRASDKIRVVAKYNATQSHTGVMGLFYFAIHEIEEDASKAGGFFKHYNKFAILTAIAILVFAVSHFARKHNDYSKRQGYDKVPTSMNL